MNSKLLDESAVAETYLLLVGEGNVTEVRCLEATIGRDKSWPRTLSGYFDDGRKLATALKKITAAKGIYLVPNEVNPALLARANNRLRPTPKGESTSDGDVVRRRWLLIDLDAVRPAGVSASAAEHSAAIGRARQVYLFLREQGWPEPIVADSGNGAHLLYHIDLPADDGGLVQRCLVALAERFDDDFVRVDRSVFNPARIWKLYGTLSAKGDSTDDRPHRMSKVLSRPETLEMVSAELLEQIATDYRQEEPQQQDARRSSAANGVFDVAAFIARHHIDADGPHDWQGKQGTGKRWTFRESPMCQHGDGAAHIEQHASGAITAGCHHQSCSWGWRELREEYEPKHAGNGSQQTADSNDDFARDLQTFTEVENGRRVVAKFGDDLRWCEAWKSWLVWNGVRWCEDDQRRVDAMAKAALGELFDRAAAAFRNGDNESGKRWLRFAKSSNSRRGIDAAVSLARSEDGVAITPAELDADPWLLNVQNGTLDLRTGKLRRHSRADLLTKSAPVVFDPDAEAPVFRKFLRDAIPDAEVRQFIQRAAGMSLCGEVTDHVLLLCHGNGANGKSTLLNVLLAVFGDYGLVGPESMLLETRSDANKSELAALFGKRLVACNEAGAGRRLAESLVKQLTGGDCITARRLFQNFFSFTPTHTIWLAANHKPRIGGQDDGIWRRILLVPFEVTIPPEERDPELPAKLLHESSGILNWVMLGLAAWREDGLQPPAHVVAATQDYRVAEDGLADFIDACCTRGAGYKVERGVIYAAYTAWCERQAWKPWSRQRLYSALEERGFKAYRTPRGRGFEGLTVTDMTGSDS